MTHHTRRIPLRLAAPLAAILIATITAVTTASAHAYEGAFFPTQSAGNRGVDVEAIQRLLQHHGLDVDATGVYDQTTVDAVTTFQSDHGLDPDGIAGPDTWEALAPRLEAGATGPAVEALPWDPDGRLWASKLGQNTWDEPNLIEPGGNYGWPVCEGTCGDPRYVEPKATWSPAEASPSGLAYAQNTLWMASLRGQRLWGIPIAGGEVDGDPVAFFVNEHGRLRAIEPAPDGSLWLATNTGGQVLRLELAA
jgi:Glucose / Sorbosone dehydrogenase/Putative peptidoglycan binding domain